MLNPKEELARLIAMKNRQPQRFNLYMLELERDDPQAARRLMRDIRRQEGCLSFLYSSVLMVIAFSLLAAGSWAVYGAI